jgi:hypothetical protein
MHGKDHHGLNLLVLHERQLSDLRISAAICAAD